MTKEILALLIVTAANNMAFDRFSQQHKTVACDYLTIQYCEFEPMKFHENLIKLQGINNRNCSCALHKGVCAVNAQDAICCDGKFEKY